MLTIACVLKSGGIYTPEWVRKLQTQCRWHAPAHRFVCLSDMDVGDCEIVRFKHHWNGWWSKIELFRPGLFGGPVVYFDLDTLIIGSIADLCSYKGQFAALRDFYHPDQIGSGVMAWSESDLTTEIYREYVRTPIEIEGGDQSWIGRMMPEADRLQALFPGQIASYKADHCFVSAPRGSRVICFHGQPKQSNCGGWAQEMWRRAA